MIKDLKIDIGDVIVVNDIRVERVSKIYYKVNEEVKVKKHIMLDVLNDNGSFFNADGTINIQKIIDKAKSYYAVDLNVEQYADDVLIINDTVYIDYRNYADNFEIDEEGLHTTDIRNQEKLNEIYADIQNKRRQGRDSFTEDATGLSGACSRWTFRTEPSIFERVDFKLVDFKNIDEIIKLHCVEDYYGDYISYDGYNSIRSFIYNIKDEVERECAPKVNGLWYSEKSRDEYELVYMRKVCMELREIQWKCNTLDEVRVELNKWLEINRPKFKAEKQRMIEIGMDKKELIKVVKELVKGKSYKQACRLLHPDMNRDTDTTEKFQILQDNKDKWFDKNGEWIEVFDWFGWSYKSDNRTEDNWRDDIDKKNKRWKKTKYPF